MIEWLNDTIGLRADIAMTIFVLATLACFVLWLHMKVSAWEKRTGKNFADKLKEMEDAVEEDMKQLFGEKEGKDE